jgi:hypothetical protein
MIKMHLKGNQVDQVIIYLTSVTKVHDPDLSR